MKKLLVTALVAVGMLLGVSVLAEPAPSGEGDAQFLPAGEKISSPAPEQAPVAEPREESVKPAPKVAAYPSRDDLERVAARYESDRARFQQQLDAANSRISSLESRLKAAHRRPSRAQSARPSQRIHRNYTPRATATAPKPEVNIWKTGDDEVTRLQRELKKARADADSAKRALQWIAAQRAAERGKTMVASSAPAAPAVAALTLPLWAWVALAFVVGALVVYLLTRNGEHGRDGGDYATDLNGLRHADLPPRNGWHSARSIIIGRDRHGRVNLISRQEDEGEGPATQRPATQQGRRR